MEIIYRIFIWSTQHFLPFIIVMLLFQDLFSWHKRYERHKKIILLAITFFGSTINLFITVTLMQNNVRIFHIYAMIEFGFYLILGLIFFQGNAFKKIFIIMQFMVITWLLRFACVNILALIEGYYLSINVHYIATAFANFMALLFSRYISAYIKNCHFEYKLPIGYWIFMYCFTFIEYFCGIMINDLLTGNQLIGFQAIILQIGLLGIIIAVFHFFVRLCNNYQGLIQQSLITKELQMQKQHFIESQNIYDNLRELQHEFKNQIFYMDYLLEKEDYTSLHKYFVDYYDKKTDKFGFGESGNDIINAVLSQKRNIAKQKGIEMHFNTSYIPEKTTIEDIDLCTILSNLLDNAIEGCKNLLDAKIHVLMRMVKNHLHIVIENSIAENILEQNPTLQTTKENKFIHGLGLKIIDSIVEKYEGVINYQCENGLFRVSLSLQQPDNIKGKND